ncbi:MAG: transcriptional regulator PpsR [Pseudomonadota bacterium]
MDASTGQTSPLLRSSDDFEALTPSVVAALMAAAADVAVVLDDEGVVKDLAVSDTELPQDVFENWIGRPFRDSVSVESRDKVKRLLSVAGEVGAVVTQTHVNHPRPGGGDDLPVLYSSAPLGQGAVIALGRDLSPIAAAQRRLLSAQRQSEREHQKIKLAEARYREYYQLSAEPSMFLDADDRVAGANFAAQAHWSRTARLLGRKVADLVAPADREALFELITEARRSRGVQSGVMEMGRVILAPLRQERGVVLMRVCEPTAQPATIPDRLARVVEAMPDGFVVTDGQFNILLANGAFAAMTEAGEPPEIMGTSLDRWLGRPGVDLSVIRTALAETGTLRSFATVVKGELGQVHDVDVSAAKVTDVDGDYVGLSVRQALASDAVLPTRSAEQLADLVGRVPIKEIVRETTDTIERMCIEAALELSGDNRASAAELLGLSRQSLYVKMRRFGIVDVEDPGA